jgi:hypothetical protein
MIHISFKNECHNRLIGLTSILHDLAIGNLGGKYKKGLDYSKI